MLEHDHIIKKFKEEFAPDIAVCVGHDFNRPYAIVDRAIELHADKVQLFKPYFTQEMIDKAKEHGIICNVFWSDDPDEARAYRAMGIDTILTNDFLAIKNALER
jgi:glycerophosphoryl diester phosphodiesterase